MRNDNAQHIVRLAPRGASARGTVLEHASASSQTPHDSTYFTPTQLKGSALRKTIKVAIVEKRQHSLSSTLGLTLATGVLGKVASILLIPMIFLQPLLPLYAADESVAPAPEAPAPVAESAPPVVDEPAPTPAPTETPVDTQTPTEASSEEAPPAEEVVDATETVSESAPTVDEEVPAVEPEKPALEPADDEIPDADTPLDAPVDIPTGEEGGATGTSTDEVPPTVGGSGGDTSAETSTSTPSTDETPLPSDETSNSASTTDEVAPLPEDGESTTTDEISGDEEIVPENPDNAGASDAGAAFDREAQLRAELKREIENEFLSGCISFEHTGYYCVKDGESASAPLRDEAVITVESEQGTGGDKEIFLQKDGVRTQLTENEWDDAFPAQDISGKHLVWQGMKGGRWQIFYADNSGSVPKVMQVTDSRESNFNPKVDGDHIVWQGWVDENWEVFLGTRREHLSPLAGEHLPEANRLMNVGPEWEVERLTTNTEHDMFPSLHGDIVTWQAREGANWIVYAYSMSQQTRTKLSSDGVKSENPRFAITWEERDEAGRARLMSYDVATGKKVDLTTASRQLPDDPFRDPPVTPITQKDQAALPTGGSGTSTTPRGEDDASGDNPVLP